MHDTASEKGAKLPFILHMSGPFPLHHSDMAAIYPPGGLGKV